LFVTRLCVCDITATHSIDLSDSVRVMTMLDQLLQILSPQKDLGASGGGCNHHSSGHSGGRKFNKKQRNWIKKGKKSEKKPIIEEKKVYLEESFLQTKPEGIDLPSLMSKPSHVDTKEWIATQTINLFHNINAIYGTISEFCTAETCPAMQGPCQTQYTWIEERGKKVKTTAAQYIDYVMTYCQKSISNQHLFPTKYAHDFQDNFYTEMRKLHRFLFNVLAHLYYAHCARLQQMDMHQHLNTVYKHFIILSRAYQLVDPRDTCCLADLTDAMDEHSNAIAAAVAAAAASSTSNVQLKQPQSLQQQMPPPQAPSLQASNAT